jgi:hypothetical protein
MEKKSSEAILAEFAAACTAKRAVKKAAIVLFVLDSR